MVFKVSDIYCDDKDYCIVLKNSDNLKPSKITQFEIQQHSCLLNAPEPQQLNLLRCA